MLNSEPCRLKLSINSKASFAKNRIKKDLFAGDIGSKYARSLPIYTSNNNSHFTYYSKSRSHNKMTNTTPLAFNIYYVVSILLLTVCAVSKPATSLQGSQLLSALRAFNLMDLNLGVDSYTRTLKIETKDGLVKPAGIVPAKNVKDAKLSWEASDDQALHTVLLLDLDRRFGNQSTSSYNLYTNINIPGNNILGGNSIVSFESPRVPCQASLKHRILALVYKQGQSIDINDVVSISASAGRSAPRENFKFIDFVSRHNLQLYALNMFYATGESGVLCSGSAALYPSPLVAMVIVFTTIVFSLTAQQRSKANGI